ncbi:MAG TPA: hypothetical protein VGH82_06315 [Gaiellaceae bacterium]|jgi:hypothetical protein
MATMDSTFARSSAYERRSGAVTALSLVQLAVGYEWLVSGLSKVANGDFAPRLASQLSELASHASPWYGSLLRSAVVPHALAFGYLIELTELAAGFVLVGVAVAELAAGARITPRARRRLQRLAVTALIAGILMLANFELANGGTFGLRLASDSFDEGVDLDTMMIATQLALLVALVPAFRRNPASGH